MSYIRDYSDLSPETAQAQALADIRDHLGTETFDRLIIENRPLRVTREAWLIACDLLLGISGYPADVLFDYIWPNSQPTSASASTKGDAP